MSLKKKIIILVTIVTIFILCIVGYFLYDYFTPSTVTSTDQKFSLTIPGKVKYKTRQDENKNYNLELYSIKDEMFIYSTVIEKTEPVQVKNAVQMEKDDLANVRKELKDITDISERSLDSGNAYEYSYTYYDESYQDHLFAQIVWIETEKNIYILDCEVITKNQEKYKPIFNKIISSFDEHNS